MNKPTFLTVVILLITMQSFGQNFIKNYFHRKQEKRTERYENEQIWRSNALGLSQQNTQNLVFSPLIYSGLGVSAQSVQQNHYRNRINYIEVNLSANVLQPTHQKTTLLSATTSLSYGKLKKQTEKFYWGGEASIFLATRFGGEFQNNAIQAESGIFLSPKIVYKTPITKKLTAEVQFSMPVVGYSMATPTYAYSFDNIDIKLNSLHNSFMPRIGTFVMFKPQKRFKNKQLRVGYQWQMMRVDRGNENTLTNGIHSVYIIGNLAKIK